MNHKESKHALPVREHRRKAKAKAIRARNFLKMPKLALQDICAPRNNGLLSTFDKSILSFRGSPKRKPGDLRKLLNKKEGGKRQTDGDKETKKNIRLYYENSRRYKNFKLFKEDESSLGLENISSQYEDPVCDDDCMTENEQIESAIKSMESSLKNGIKAYFKDKTEVENLRKYQRRRFR